MPVLKEVIDGVKYVSESIDNLQKITKAARDGKEYLLARYKNASKDVILIFEEIKKSLETMSGASSIITSFAFVEDQNSYSRDLREFNNKTIEAKTRITKLRNEIDDYRGHCSKIKKHEKKILKGTKLDDIFLIFGIDTLQRRAELSSLLKQIYEEEQQQYLFSYTLCKSIEKAIDDIMKVLGGPGVMKPDKVPEAIKLLRAYAGEILKIETKADDCVHLIRELIVDISK